MFLDAKELFTKKNKVIIGYDLSYEYAQLSVLPLNSQEEPETVSTVAGAEQFQIPLALCKRKEVNQWFYGKEALRCAAEGGGVLVEDLCRRAFAREQIVVEEESFSAVSLLALYMKRTLSLVQSSSTDALAGFLITVPELDQERLTVLGETAALLQLKTDRIFVHSHMESFYEYTIHQPKELWKNQVVVFDYSGDYMRSYRMECNKRTTPIVSFIEENAWPKLYKQPFLKEEDKEAVYREWDRLFAAAAQEVLATRLVSSVYLIGEGFHGDWCRESLKLICRGRRVFQGSNLYSKGACYGAAEKLEQSPVGRDYVFLGNDKIKSNVGMRILRRGEPSYYALLDAGVTWFEATGGCEVILESGNSFTLMVTPVTKGASKELEVILDGLAERGRGLTRLAICVSMLSVSRCRIEIEDLGFGEIAPATHQKWREEFEL